MDQFVVISDLSRAVRVGCSSQHKLRAPAGACPAWNHRRPLTCAAFICFFFSAAALLLAAGQASAADDTTCGAYVKEAVAKAQAVRQLSCGYDLNDPRWTTDRKAHARWCKATERGAVERETAQRRGQMKLCQTCSIYAELAVSSAADNGSLKCGFSGPRWNETATGHFGWCMALRRSEAPASVSEQAHRLEINKVIEFETGARLNAVANCKLRRSGLLENRGPIAIAFFDFEGRQRASVSEPI